MRTLLTLILLPLLPAIALAVVRSDLIRGAIVRISALAIAALSVFAAVRYLGNPVKIDLAACGLNVHAIDLGVFGVEAVMTAVLLAFCFIWKTRQWWIPLLIVAQFAIVAWCEFGAKGVAPVRHHLVIDDFAVIMAVIIGVIGSAICVYALGYMKDWVHHHAGEPDRRRGFFFILFFFLAGMFGIVFSNNLLWMFLCWEITTLSSFLLIGYPRTEEANRNAFRALGFNALGGLAFALALLWMTTLAPEGKRTVELSELLGMGQAAAMIPAVLIGFAGMTKSAQLPFSSWLLGAMVAPTPVSALLHSSTMVKAGVFVLVKFAPIYHHTAAGYLIAVVGGVTFLMTSIAAVTQPNAKRVLAYSTIANLGLVVMCAGVGSAEAVWAAIMLIVFHAVAKALLFLSVGSIEHRIGSRDIEDMDGLLVVRPGLAIAVVVGILGMFLAPFGMLISKWSCLQAITRVGDFPPLLPVLLAFGSAPTLVFWCKWLGKVISISEGKKGEGSVPFDEALVLLVLAVLTVAATCLFPILATHAVEPYIRGAGYGAVASLGWSTLIIMFIMLGLIAALPVLYLISPKDQVKVNRYLAGANLGSGPTFRGSLGEQTVNNANYYLADYFPEAKVVGWSCAVAALITAAAIATAFIAR